MKLALVSALCLAACVPSFAADTKTEIQARKAMDDFMTAFNSRGPGTWAASLNYPHVRFASNEVRIWNTADEFAQNNADYARGLSPSRAPGARLDPSWDHTSLPVVRSAGV